MTCCDGDMFPYSSSLSEDTTTVLSTYTADDNTNIISTQIDSNSSSKPNEIIDPTRQLIIAIEFYFHYAVITIGIFGMAANGLVLYAFISHHARQTKKRAVNLLMINQNLLDFTACVLLVITFSLRVSNIDLTGALGYFLCVIFISENSTNCTLCGSVVNLMAITVERYLKVVHPFWSRKYLKRWMIYAAMVFSWVGGILPIAPVAFVTTIVDDGICLAFAVWESARVSAITNAWYFSFYFVVPVTLLIFCYGRIVVVMNRQMKVMAAHNVEASGHMSTAQLHSKRAKWNVIKTMIIVSVTFVICFTPSNIYFLFVDITTTSILYGGYYATVSLSYIYICMNPFIYAIKHEGVKEELGRILKVCRKRVDGLSSRCQ